MSGKSQSDLVLKEEIHVVLHGHTIQQWTSLRYIVDTSFVHVANIDIAKGGEFETFSCFLCQVISSITIPLNLSVS